LHSIKEFSALHTTLLVRRLGLHKKLEGDTTGTDDSGWLGSPRPCHVASCSAVKTGEKKEESGDGQRGGVCLPK